MHIQDLALRFNNLLQHEGYEFDCQPIPGCPDVLQITVTNLDPLPIFLTITEQQILCIAYLWTEEQIIEEHRLSLLESLLELNVPMPLSSFAKSGDKYLIFGALSIHSSFDDIIHEIITLHENALEATTALQTFLK
ncbi:YjfI family protein [Zooshikella ganghwensis]|uniref:DUF2170 family protein n=1 Tax=Zooshikella ganghwensis TaxID=202772 RepID=A0A4P9VTJ6_9GAMM|nr:DUF2170 family protein [Zooshikella ganghwensis]RDH45754.1 DUF2170 family protein [Zooshikella ganghwensis]